MAARAKIQVPIATHHVGANHMRYFFPKFSKFCYLHPVLSASFVKQNSSH
jgi:hypothetical protein